MIIYKYPVVSYPMPEITFKQRCTLKDLINSCDNRGGWMAYQTLMPIVLYRRNNQKLVTISVLVPSSKARSP